tara:strand:+ start:495 stop:908 length:414 start_codon:yes stop_codon:yes gene_type:complete
MHIKRQSKSKSEISTASLPDIIFMLLIFFMVTTVIKKYDGLPGIVPPKAEELKQLKNKRDVAYIWVTKDGVISIDDQLVNVENISDIMSLKLANNPRLTVSLKADETTTMEFITLIHEELREAGALKINYQTKTKKI